MNNTAKPPPGVPPLVELPWYERFCPDLTHAEMLGHVLKRHTEGPSMVVGARLQANGPKAVEAPKAEPELVGCQGPRCMAFRVLNDAAGNLTGQCAKFLPADGSLGQAQATRELTKVMSGGTVPTQDGVART